MCRVPTSKEKSKTKTQLEEFTKDIDNSQEINIKWFFFHFRAPFPEIKFIYQIIQSYQV